MSMSKWFTETAYIITRATCSAFPYNPRAAQTCTAFQCAIDQVGSMERLIAGDMAPITTHVILCDTSVALSSNSIIRYDGRYFNVVDRPDKIPLRPGHHQEVMVQEVSGDGL